MDININNNRLQLFLRSPGQCFVSEYEAETTLQHAKEQENIDPEIRELVSQDMLTILGAYKAGLITYSGPDYSESSQTIALSKEANVEQQIIYGSESFTSPDTKDKVIKSISEMDFEALKKEKPFGSIKPPILNALFKSAPLRVPCSRGYINDLGYGDYNLSKLEELSSVLPENCSGKSFLIQLPNMKSILYVPSGCLVTADEGSFEKIAKPTEYDPIIWRGKRKSLSGVYTIHEVNNASELLKADTKNLFFVSKEEQDYWRTVLPLPKALTQKLEQAQRDKNADRIIDLITSYMAFPNKETNLSNFRYACHPRLGQFYIENADDLPLLVNELKVGHCDLLSWYKTALYRAYGLYSWVSTNTLPTKDGTAFNGAYTHAIGLISKFDGVIVEDDPTKHSNFDRAYHPDILSDELIDVLEEKLLEANTRAEKAEIIRQFNKEVLPPLRRFAGTKTKVMQDLDEIIRNGPLGNIIGKVRDETRIKINTEKHSVKHNIASWSPLPTEKSTEVILKVISDVMASSQYNNIHGINELETILKISKTGHREIKEQIAWLYEAFNSMRSFAFAMYLSGKDEKEFLPDKKLSGEDLYRIYLHNKGDDFSSFCPGPMLERTTAEDILNAYDKTITGRVASFNNFSYGDALSALNLVPTVSDWKRIENHEYSTFFLSALNMGLFPSIIDSNFDYVWDTKSFKSNKETSKLVYSSSKEPHQLRRDLAYFAFDYQGACKNPDYRRSFLKKFNMTESDLRNLSREFLGYKSASFRIVRNIFPGKDKNSFNADLIYNTFYLDEKCRRRLALSVNNILMQLDLGHSKSSVKEFTDTRRYLPGDDLRKIDWNAYARLDEIHLKDSPVYRKDMNTPIHVCIEAPFGGSGYEPTVYIMQIGEILRNIQNNSKQHNREVYISFGEDYYKLPLHMQPKDIIERLRTSSVRAPKEGYNHEPILSNGKLPKNILYVAYSFNNISAFYNLYGTRCNLAHICLHEKPFRIYPLVKPEWIENINQ